MSSTEQGASLRIIELAISFDIARCSPNRRIHWAERAREVRAARFAARLAWREAGCPKMIGPVDVSLLLRRARKMDPDNALAACKGICDGLFQDGITPDDSQEWIRYVGVRQETGGGYRGREEIVVRVTAREA